MDGQTRRLLFGLLASAAVTAAEKHEGEWQEPFTASGWDAVIYEDGWYTVGSNRDYENFQDREDAATALAAGWALSADADMVADDLSQEDIDGYIVEAAQDSLGLLV